MRYIVVQLLPEGWLIQDTRRAFDSFVAVNYTGEPHFSTRQLTLRNSPALVRERCVYLSKEDADKAACFYNGLHSDEVHSNRPLNIVGSRPHNKAYLQRLRELF